MNLGQEVADPETTTTNGCQCSSTCGASVSDFYTHDWCYTENECGEYTFLKGYWDYCVYKNTPSYNDLSWQDKEKIIWDQVTSDASLGGYYPTKMFTESVMTTFENEWDFLPNGRQKVIHGNGAICKFDLEVSKESPFSGLLQAGSKVSGLIRMGPATDSFADTTQGMSPGVSIKFLRTGTNSANFLLLHTLAPLPDNSFNFFQAPMTNHLPAEFSGVALYALGKKFCSTGHCVTKNGISNVCTHDQDGNEAEELVYPFKFTFESADVSFPNEAPESMEKFMDQFRVLPVGTKLYQVKAHQSPEDTEGLFLGNLVTASQCVTSHYGDTKLAFKHQWIEEDLEMRPQWSEAYYDQCYCNVPE